MKLFERKMVPPVLAGPVTKAGMIRKLREQLDTLEKRESHLDKKILMQVDEARKKSLAKDKRGAIFALKRKKMLKSEVEKLQGARMTLETQVMTLESAHVNMETFNAMRAGANQLKAIDKMDDVDEITEEIQEEIARGEITVDFSPVPDMNMYDEDELEDELRRLMEKVTVEDAVAAPQIPTSSSVAAAAAPTDNLPDVLTHAVKPRITVTDEVNEVELEELHRLEASIAM